MIFFNILWRKLVFFIGDIRALNTFPWLTWSIHQHEIDYDEILEVLPLIEYGDIGIHRDKGYLSNIAIPGFMKHAWIHISDTKTMPHIVEAISEGVIERNAIYPMFSDFSILLSPKAVSDKERRGACKKAKGVIGEKYDVHFKFDIEKELHYYTGKKPLEAKHDLELAQENLQNFDGAFSCTELVSYAWWHKREDLRLYRKKNRGKSVILADDFLSNAWTIKWASKSVTVENARKMGLHEEGLEMLKKYWQDKE